MYYLLSLMGLGSGGGKSNTPRHESSGDNDAEPETDWNAIGMRIAFVGGVYPLAVGFCLLLLTLGYWLLFGLPAAIPAGWGVLLQLAVLIVIGFPFLLFVCFLLSSLATVLLMSVVVWTARSLHMRIMPVWITAICGGLIGLVWTILLCIAIGR
jgi:hypothetical protein